MRITKEQLKQIIKEEISNFGNLNEMASSELERAEQMLKDAMSDKAKDFYLDCLLILNK